MLQARSNVILVPKMALASTAVTQTADGEREESLADSDKDLATKCQDAMPSTLAALVFQRGALLVAPLLVPELKDTVLKEPASPWDKKPNKPWFQKP